MTASYEFRGAVRWTILPALVAAGGAIVSVIEEFVYSPSLRIGPGVAAAAGAAFAFPIGAAMAVGRRPAVAVVLAFLFGAMSLYVAAAVMSSLLGMPVTFDTRGANLGAVGGAAAIVVMAHHLYLRVRGLGAAGVMGGVMIYLLASTAAARLAMLLSRDVMLSDILRRGAAGGLLQWLALEAAIRLSERAAPAPTPPAPDA